MVDKKIYFINDANDKIFGIVQNVISETNNEKIYLFAGILEKKSKLRNFFETNTKTLCVPCYPDNDRDLEIIANKNNFLTDEVIGMKFNLFSKKWFKSNDTSVNYISTFLKN